jgi:hypothetical protein
MDTEYNNELENTKNENTDDIVNIYKNKIVKVIWNSPNTPDVVKKTGETDTMIAYTGYITNIITTNNKKFIKLESDKYPGDVYLIDLDRISHIKPLNESMSNSH